MHMSLLARACTAYLAVTMTNWLLEYRSYREVQMLIERLMKTVNDYAYGLRSASRLQFDMHTQLYTVIYIGTFSDINRFHYIVIRQAAQPLPLESTANTTCRLALLARGSICSAPCNAVSAFAEAHYAPCHSLPSALSWVGLLCHLLDCPPAFSAEQQGQECKSNEVSIIEVP